MILNLKEWSVFPIFNASKVFYKLETLFYRNTALKAIFYKVLHINIKFIFTNHIS